MNRRMGLVSVVSLACTLVIVQTPRPMHAADDDHSKKLSVTVSFGAGLNTTGAANHHIMPGIIDVKAGGTVNFAVAGFHQIFVYRPGVRLEDLDVPAWDGVATQEAFWIHDFAPEKIYYRGINPANGMNPGGGNADGPHEPPNATNTLLRSHLQNRIESVGFAQPGIYLVICSINPHFRDGMYAWVRVSQD